MKHISTDDVKQMAGKEGLVIQGCGGDLDEWVSGINEMLTEAGILLNGDTFKNIYVFEHSGVINMLFDMEDIHLDIGRLAIWRLQTHSNFAGAWLSDYLPNQLGVDIDAYAVNQEQENPENLSDDVYLHSVKTRSKAARSNAVKSETDVSDAVNPDVANTATVNPDLSDANAVNPNVSNAAAVNSNNTHSEAVNAGIYDSWTIRVNYCYGDSGNRRVNTTVEFPAKYEQINKFIKDAGLDDDYIHICFIESMETVIPGLEDALPDDLDIYEINRLAKSIGFMNEAQRKFFAKSVTAEQLRGNIGHIINFAEGVDSYDFQTQILKRSIRVHIKNVHCGNICGFTAPLPATTDDLKPDFDNAEIIGWKDMEISEVTTTSNFCVSNRLGEILSANIQKTMSPFAIEELNYLAARVNGMSEAERDIFNAVIDADRHCGGVSEIINLTFPENLNCFEFKPAYDEIEYGEFLADTARKDKYAEALNRLESSDNPFDNAIAAYIGKLEKHIDFKALGQTAAKEENGIFTEAGYMTEDEGFREFYKGVQDIPNEYRIFTKPGDVLNPLTAVKNIEIATMLVRLHALTGNPASAASNSIKPLIAEQCSDYLLSVRQGGVLICRAIDAYKHSDNDFEKQPMEMFLGEEHQDVRIFAVHITNNYNGKSERGVTGDLIELNIGALRSNILRYAVMPDYMDTVSPDGARKSYDFSAWADTPREERGIFTECNPRYPVNDLRFAEINFDSLLKANEDACKEISLNEFLSEINAPFMESAKYPQPDMLRLSNDAARQILASDCADVYKLTENGAVKLAPLEAAKPVCFAEYTELAVTRGDMPKVEDWAKRSANKIIRKIERSELEESKRKRDGL